jgi:hypothetical protein
MTTWTTEDLQNAIRDGEEGIPFFGWVKINAEQDKKDREEMLRNQLLILQAECQRLRKKLHDAGIHD